jgi:hypothetical protein
MSVELQSFLRLQPLGTVEGILYVTRIWFHRSMLPSQWLPSLLMHAATKQQRHITGEKRPRPTFCFAVQSLGMNVRERLHLVFLEIRMHRFIYLKNYCSYVVAISLACFLFCCSIPWGMNFRERLPFGVPRNPHAPVYLFKELLLISRCHVIALLFVLLLNILGNEFS